MTILTLQPPDCIRATLPTQVGGLDPVLSRSQQFSQGYQQRMPSHLNVSTPTHRVPTVLATPFPTRWNALP